MEVARCDGRGGKGAPLDGGGNDVEHHHAEDFVVGEGVVVVGLLRVGVVNGQAVADACAAVVAAENDVAVGAEDRGEGLEKGGADCPFGVVGLWGRDAVSGEFGDEEGDVWEEERGEVAPPDGR